MESYSESYRKSGVDITAGYAGVKLMAPHVARTRIPGVVSGIGGFGGLFAPDLTGIREPVLVSGTDGVGTKIRIAQLLDRHDTVGVDCVAMCVNDIICCGAKPLFFLDYIAIGKNVPEKVAAIVSGVAEGCVQAGCALIGGETAEMPGFYPEDEYDLPDRLFVAFRQRGALVRILALLALRGAAACSPRSGPFARRDAPELRPRTARSGMYRLVRIAAASRVPDSGRRLHLRVRHFTPLPIIR